MREQKWRRWVVPKAFLSSLSFSPLLVFNLHPLPWARVCASVCLPDGGKMNAKRLPGDVRRPTPARFFLLLSFA